jgi:hypothetical protein
MKYNFWFPKEQADMFVNVINNIEKQAMWYAANNKIEELRNKRKEINGDNLKWAWVRIGNTRKMCWVDNATMKAYKADGYGKTNMEIKHFTFERWCTSFDL